MCIQFGSPCVSIGFLPFTRQILKLKRKESWLRQIFRQTAHDCNGACGWFILIYGQDAPVSFDTSLKILLEFIKNVRIDQGRNLIRFLDECPLNIIPVRPTCRNFFDFLYHKIARKMTKTREIRAKSGKI